MNLYAQNTATLNNGGVAAFLVPLLVVITIFYFLLVRPQKKQMNKEALLQNSLQKGDEIITHAGIIGVVDRVEDKILFLQLENGASMRILKNEVAAMANVLDNSSKQAPTGKGKSNQK